MNKVKFLVCLFVASLALTACSIEDNPSEDPTKVIIDDPQNEVTDEPAYAPGL
jgi:outer membrane biogenesis lipoprotein LolB